MTTDQATTPSPQRHLIDLVNRLIAGVAGRADGFDIDVLDVVAELPPADLAVLEAFAERMLVVRNAYIPAKELARRWRVPKVTIIELATSGALIGTLHGKKWYFREIEIDRYLRTHTLRYIDRYESPAAAAIGESKSGTHVL